MIRLSAPRVRRAIRAPRLSLFFAAALGLIGSSSLGGVASAQEQIVEGNGTFGGPGYAGPGYGGPGYGNGYTGSAPGFPTAGPGPGYGGCASCGTGSCGTCQQPCNNHHCPTFQHCMEGAPRIHIKMGCPRPVCNPCAQPNWGYYEKCWNPWPFPPNWSHCPTPPPAATVAMAERAYGGLTPFYGPDPQTSAPTMAPTTRPGYVPPMPQTLQPQPPSMPPTGPAQPPLRTTPMPSPVPSPMPMPSNPGAGGFPGGNPFESLPTPRQESLRPMPGNFDGF